MRTIQGVRVSWLTVALGACVLIAGVARADIITSDRPGSILIFPKVVCDGTRETVIQIANTGNMMDQARCFYLNGQPGRSGAPVCSEIDFELALTKQQPTHWRVCSGRAVDAASPLGSDGAGLDPGLVPPVPAGFTGALVCAEVLPDGTPVGMNQLKGEATILGPLADESKYNALAVQGFAAAGANNGDNILGLGSEYNFCPAASILNFIPNGGNDPIIEAFGNAGLCVGGTNDGAPCNNGTQCDSTICSSGDSSVLTNLTLLPCNLDFENGIPASVSVNFLVRDEFETPSSGSTTISCWANLNIGTIPALTAGSIATQYATVRITSSSGGPIVGVAESFHSDSAANTAAAAVNLHMQGLCVGGTVPPGTFCNSAPECGDGGTCAGQPAAIVLSNQ